jgi:tRNA-dependent cyclodipeptide synthase
MTKRKACNLTGIKYRISKKTDWETIPFDKRIVSFEISLNNQKCCGKDLLFLLNWAKSKFSHFHFCLGDTLNSYTYLALNGNILEKGNNNWFDAEKKYRDLGDKWIEKNRSIIRSVIGDNYKIYRWSLWRKHPMFNYYFESLERIISEDSYFKKIIYEDIKSYVRRKGLLSILEDNNRIRFISNYMLEELAVYTIQAHNKNIVNLYPGSPFKIFNLINSFENIPKKLKNRHFIYIDTKNG